MKLVLMETTTNKVTTGKGYLFKHLTVGTFDNIKFVKSTVIHEVDHIDNTNIDNPELKENILTGQCICGYIEKTPCCMVCNESLPTGASDDEMITSNNCNITTL